MPAQRILNRGSRNADQTISIPVASTGMWPAALRRCTRIWASNKTPNPNTRMAATRFTTSTPKKCCKYLHIRWKPPAVSHPLSPGTELNTIYSEHLTHACTGKVRGAPKAYWLLKLPVSVSMTRLESVSMMWCRFEPSLNRKFHKIRDQVTMNYQDIFNNALRYPLGPSLHREERSFKVRALDSVKEVINILG